MGSWASVVRALASLAVLVSVSQAVAQSPGTEQQSKTKNAAPPAEVAEAHAFFNQGEWKEAISKANLDEATTTHLKKTVKSYRHVLLRLKIMEAMAWIEMGYTKSARLILEVEGRESKIHPDDGEWLRVAQQDFKWASSKVAKLLHLNLPGLKIQPLKNIDVKTAESKVQMAEVQPNDNKCLSAFKAWCQGCDALGLALEMSGEDRHIEALAKLELSREKLEESQKEFDGIAPENVMARLRLACDKAELVAARAVIMGQGGRGDIGQVVKELGQKRQLFHEKNEECAAFGAEHPVSRRVSVSHATFCLVSAKALRDLKSRVKEDEGLRRECEEQEGELKKDLVGALGRLRASVGPPGVEESLPLQNLYCRDALLLELAALDEGYAVGDVRERSRIIEDINAAFSEEAQHPSGK